MDDLFLELAKPVEITGISRWVDVSEFVGKYKKLQFNNGRPWGRPGSPLA